jgi:hypothetical protein
MDGKFPAFRPNSEVVELLERVLESSREGRIRTIAIIAVSVANDVEVVSCGDHSDSKKHALMGGLCRSVIELVTKP